MSFVWKVEDMALMNEKSNIYIGNEKIYNAENKLTRQEKIDFLDSMNDGLTSYILNLADKLKEDKENGVIKKDTYGEMKAISYIAWINRNDTRNCIGNSTYNRGEIRFSPCRNINRLDTNVKMRIEVEKQQKDINKAMAILSLRQLPGMRKATTEELDSATEYAKACMYLVLNYMSDKDMTLKELKKEIEQEKSFNINIDNILPD